MAPLVRSHFVSLLPRTSRRASLGDLQGRKVHLPRHYVSLWASGDLRSSALMVLLPSIALPPCSLGRCSDTKIRDPLAVGRVRTSRLVCDPSLYLSLRHPVVQLQPPYRSLAGTPLLSFASLPCLCTPRLLRAGCGPLYAAAYFACFTSNVFRGTVTVFCFVAFGLLWFTSVVSCLLPACAWLVLSFFIPSGM